MEPRVARVCRRENERDTSLIAGIRGMYVELRYMVGNRRTCRPVFKRVSRSRKLLLHHVCVCMRSTVAYYIPSLEIAGFHAGVSHRLMEILTGNLFNFLVESDH